MRPIVKFLILFPALFLIIGCAGTGNDILDQDPTAMTDEALLTYYYQLEEEIAKCERQSNRPSVGIGTGFGGQGIGFGFGISQGIGNCNADELRQRRVDVRLQLQKRGLTP
jgi:hypothetical protein